MQAQRKRLGRGLAALIGDDTTEEAVIQDIRNLRHLPLDLLHPSPNNPRKHFVDGELDADRRRLSLSLKRVTPAPDGGMLTINSGGGGEKTQFVCGFLTCDRRLCRPALACVAAFVWIS